MVVRHLTAPRCIFPVSGDRVPGLVFAALAPGLLALIYLACSPNGAGLDRRFILRFCGDGYDCSPRFPSAILHWEAGSAN
jgi:hypothetical protein